MHTLIEIIAIVAVLTNGVIYGTDVFGAVIQRPALASVDDRSLTQVMGHVHRVADHRLQRISIVGLLATLTVTVLSVVSGRIVGATAAGLALLALIAFVVIYTRVSKPINTALTTAAVADRVPTEARQLQTRWDSVIDLRVVLQTVALAALCISLAAA